MNRKSFTLVLLILAVILFMSLVFADSSYAWGPKNAIIRLRGHPWEHCKARANYHSEDQLIFVSTNHNSIIVLHNCKTLLSAVFLREKGSSSSLNLQKKNGEITHGRFTNDR